MDILQSVVHRINLLEGTHANLSDDQRRIKWNTDELDHKIVNELNLIKKETKEMLEECKKIHKTVFEIGSLLQEQVTKKELEAFEKELDEWPIETFISHKELKPTFNRYAKQ